MFEILKNQCDQLVNQFDTIPKERKELLTKISEYIQSKKDGNLPINLMYVCTHNSRRSHFGQIWAAVAASYFGIENVNTFSGGTEATAFNPNAIQALKETGFEIATEELNENPIYKVAFGTKETQFTICFSKVYDDSFNPSSNFTAIMTCSDAEQNCPFIPGVELRIGTTYTDPKAFDGTPQQAEKYFERSNQIALECLFVFSKIS
jgi:protein-tyrosine phosphatase/arsenate reductase